MEQHPKLSELTYWHLENWDFSTLTAQDLEGPDAPAYLVDDLLYYMTYTNTPGLPVMFAYHVGEEMGLRVPETVPLAVRVVHELERTMPTERVTWEEAFNDWIVPAFNSVRF